VTVGPSDPEHRRLGSLDDRNYRPGLLRFVVECVYSQDVSPKEEQVGFIRNPRTLELLSFIGEDSEAFIVGLHKEAIEGIACLRYPDVEQLVCREIPQPI